MSLENLTEIIDRAQARLGEKNTARETVFPLTREVIQTASRTIRAVHRGEFENAQGLLAKGKETVRQMKAACEDHPDIYFAGYTHDAQKEFAESAITYALVREEPLPTPEELEVEDAAYLNGLGEAAGEMRRNVLDVIRSGDLQRGEVILQMMDEIYAQLVTIDFPHAITSNLRRTTDMVRGVLERTRGDLTMALRQQELQTALQVMEARLSQVEQ